MPELPELEVVREVLLRRVLGQRIAKVELIQPGAAIVVRNLTQSGFVEALSDSRVIDIVRRGKFMLFECEAGSTEADARLYLAINPKLTGRFQLAKPSDKRLKKCHVAFTLDRGTELRYLDQRQMGQLYLARDLAQVPEYSGLGPEPLEIGLEEFKKAIRPFRGEIKGVLTRGDFVAGIGNAYADEILWEARIHPYKKRTQLSPEEIDRLYEAMRVTLLAAIDKIRVDMGERIETEPRDFMSVHMKTGLACPRCGTQISMIGANQRITNFCRACQPGGLIKGMA